LIIVSELMDTKVETVQLTDHMAVVMEKFETQTAWNLVVLDIRKYAGIISKSDLIEHYRGMIKRSSNLF
jgi:CBS-domain-containing membrane protein